LPLGNRGEAGIFEGNLSGRGEISVRCPSTRKEREGGGPFCRKRGGGEKRLTNFTYVNRKGEGRTLPIVGILKAEKLKEGTLPVALSIFLKGGGGNSNSGQKRRGEKSLVIFLLRSARGGGGVGLDRTYQIGLKGGKKSFASAMIPAWKADQRKGG